MDEKESAMNGEQSKLVSESGAPIAAPAGAEAAPPKETDPAKIVLAKIEIVYTQDGNVSVNGPLQQEALFDWMVKKAGEAAARWRADAAQPRVAVPARVPFMARAMGFGRRLGK